MTRRRLCQQCARTVTDGWYRLCNDCYERHAAVIPRPAYPCTRCEELRTPGVRHTCVTREGRRIWSLRKSGHIHCTGCGSWSRDRVKIGPHGGSAYCPDCARVLREGGMDTDTPDLTNPLAKAFLRTFCAFILEESERRGTAVEIPDRKPRPVPRTFSRRKLLERLNQTHPAEKPFDGSIL